VRRILLDSNAVDPLCDVPGAYEAAERAVADRTHELLYTHVNVDELSETGDLDRRQRLILAMVAVGRLIPTGAFAFDYSRFDHARLAEDAEVFQAVQSGNIDDTRDALLACTADFEKCALATGDRKLRNRATARSVEVLDLPDFLAELGVRS
jgi:hypothetical protein